jgi:predicted deacylase
MSEKKFMILGREVRKGQGAILEVEVAKLHTRNSLNMPVIVERGEQDGPVLLLIGGVHGDETNGVAIVRDIIGLKYNKPIRGTVICIPVFNVFGFLNQEREFPDGRDLNRMFPGNEKGSLASQFAHKFTVEIAPLVDYVIDFHTGGADRDNFPNIRCLVEDEETLKLAKIFGAPFIVNSKYIVKSIRETLNNMGKTILLYEGGKSLEFDNFAIEKGVEGVLNVMKYLGMQKGKIKSNKSSNIIEKSKWIRAPYSGLFQSFVKNGSVVNSRSCLGRIFDPYGEFDKEIRAPFKCYIFGMNTAPIVNKGDALYHVSA